MILVKFKIILIMIRVRSTGILRHVLETDMTCCQPGFCESYLQKIYINKVIDKFTVFFFIEPRVVWVKNGLSLNKPPRTLLDKMG